MSRLAVTPVQLQRLLEVLSPLGFVPSRIELAANGSMILHRDACEPVGERDLLAEWEAKRVQTLQ